MRQHDAFDAVPLGADRPHWTRELLDIMASSGIMAAMVLMLV